MHLFIQLHTYMEEVTQAQFLNRVQPIFFFLE